MSAWVKLSFFLIIFSGVFSQAATSCPGVGGVVTKVQFLGKEDCQLARDAADIFNGMAQLFGVGPKISIVIGGPSDNASFDNGAVVRIPYRMVFYGRFGDEYDVSPVSILTCAAHEYGHAIFQEYIKSAYKGKYSDIIKKLEALSLRSLAVNEGVTDEALKTDLDTMYSSDEFLNFRKLVTYSEFYADVLAVYFRKDKSAILNSLYYNEMTDLEFNTLRLRDFAEAPDSKYYNLMAEEHTWFALTRAYVGQNLWPRNKAQAARYARYIMKAIIKVSEKNVTETTETKPVEDNQRLIEELKVQRLRN